MLDKTIFYIFIYLLLVFYSFEYYYYLLKRIIQNIKLFYKGNVKLKYCFMLKLQKKE